MKQFDFLACVTGVVLVALLTSSSIGFYQHQITWQDYRDLWSPMLGVIVGFWFRGIKSEQVTQ